MDHTFYICWRVALQTGHLGTPWPMAETLRAVGQGDCSGIIHGKSVTEPESWEAVSPFPGQLFLLPTCIAASPFSGCIHGPAGRVGACDARSDSVVSVLASCSHPPTPPPSMWLWESHFQLLSASVSSTVKWSHVMMTLYSGHEY